MASTSLPLGVTCPLDEHCLYLVTENSTYVIGITPDTGLVLHLYWGPRLYSFDDIDRAQLAPERSSQDPPLTTAPEEYPVFGGLRYGQDCLKVTFLDSKTRELDFAYSTHSIYRRQTYEEGEEQVYNNTLVIVLADRHYEKLQLELTFTLFAKTDIIERSARIVNGLDSSLHLEKALSAAFHLPPTPRHLTTLNGAWSAETQVNTTPVMTNPTSGGGGLSYTIGSIRGIPSAQSYPYFALTSDSSPLPGQQDTYFGSVAWSGNWIITVDVDYQGQTRIVGGLHPHDFGLTLLSGESFRTPEFIVGYSSAGLSGARRLLPRHITTRRQAYLRDNQPRSDSSLKAVNPVLYNSWEAATFDVTIQQQVELANKAKAMGVELFVLDDGWFKGRTSDNAGLGDWFYDRNKFPNGLKPLADHVHSLDMKFGLWFEPEMVNPDSDLYRQHPDWVYHYPDRQRSQSRNQLVLDLTRWDVRNYLYDQLYYNIDTIGIDYIKWDMNRPISEAGIQLSKENQGRDTREVWVHHVNAFYTLLRRLKSSFPDLLIESCCSGGGRADPGVMTMVDQCWASDNTQPDARLVIQHGLSLVLPPKMMTCWVTDMPQDDLASRSIPLAYRFHVSYMGALGIGSNILKYSPAQEKEAAYWINLYKQLRHVLQLGDLDWLHADHPRLAVTMTTTRDISEAVVLAFRPSSPFWLPLPLIRLRHLDPRARYQLKVWVRAEEDLGWKTFTGAHLLYKGLALPSMTSGAYNSVVVWIKRTSH